MGRWVGGSVGRWVGGSVGWWVGTVWYGMVWYGLVWYGLVWYGLVWSAYLKVSQSRLLVVVDSPELLLGKLRLFC